MAHHVAPVQKTTAPRALLFRPPWNRGSPYDNEVHLRQRLYGLRRWSMFCPAEKANTRLQLDRERVHYASLERTARTLAMLINVPCVLRTLKRQQRDPHPVMRASVTKVTPGTRALSSLGAYRVVQGSYKQTVGNQICRTCAEGKYSTTVGSVSVDECSPCPRLCHVGCRR